MKYDDETLMAYADGELDAAQRAQIDAAIAQDPGLALRVQEHKALRARMTGAFSRVLDSPFRSASKLLRTPACARRLLLVAT